jgi:hypothetical protein
VYIDQEVYIERIIKFSFLDPNSMLVLMEPNTHSNLRVDMDDVDKLHFLIKK